MNHKKGGQSYLLGCRIHVLPQFCQLASNISEAQIGVGLLHLAALVAAEQNVSRLGALGPALGFLARLLATLCSLLGRTLLGCIP